MDCREIIQLPGNYDAIICGFCMPYLAKEDCKKLIKDSAFLLNQNGIFYFSTIEGKYEESGYETGSTGDRSFVYYYNQEYLMHQLQENNFELIRLICKEYPKNPDKVSTHLIFIARKK